jgi:hypothetical protein
MGRSILTIVTAIFLGASLAQAQNWSYSFNPGKITHPSGWVFEVSGENDYDLTLTDCIGAPDPVTDIGECAFFFKIKALKP